MSEENIATENEIIDNELITEEEIEVDVEDELNYFYSGNTLGLDEVYDVMKNIQTNIIIIAGHIRSGKTTLLSTIYEKFQMGKNQLYSFSGSRTLIGFEKCTHYSRLASNGSKPQTERTRFEDEYKFLHLELIHNNNSIKKNILLSDVSGEQFEKILTSSEECLNNKIISRADHFVYVIDGEKMLDLISRETCISNVVTTIRRLAETSILLESTKINILISKSDVFHGISEKLKKTIEEVVENLITRKLPYALNKYSFDISCHWICAQNQLQSELTDSKILEIENLLDIWIGYTPKTRFEMKSHGNQSNRMIDLFNYSYKEKNNG